MSEKTNLRNGLIAAALLTVAGGLAYTNMKKYTPGPAINNGHGGDEIAPSQRADFQMMATAARITPEQQKKIAELREKGDFRQMRTQVADILTSEQRRAMREQFASRRAERDAKMKAAMGDAEYKRYQEKRNQRWGQGGQRGPRGGNRPERGPGSGATKTS